MFFPSNVQIDRITYKHTADGDIIVSDGTDWHFDITHL